MDFLPRLPNLPFAPAEQEIDLCKRGDVEGIFVAARFNVWRSVPTATVACVSQSTSARSPFVYSRGSQISSALRRGAMVADLLERGTSQPSRA